MFLSVDNPVKLGTLVSWFQDKSIFDKIDKPEKALFTIPVSWLSYK